MQPNVLEVAFDLDCSSLDEPWLRAYLPYVPYMDEEGELEVSGGHDGRPAAAATAAGTGVIWDLERCLL